MAAAGRAAQVRIERDTTVGDPAEGSQNEECMMADDIETIRRVGLQRTSALISDLQAHRAFARLTLEERALWEERAEARAQAFCDGLAADLALIPTPQDADPG